MNDFTSEQDTDLPPQNTGETPADTADTGQLFNRVDQAYQELLGKVSGNKQQVHEQRVQIAELRTRIRESATVEQSPFDEADDEDELRNHKLKVQTDDCNNLIHHIEQIREHIHHNSIEAETLLAPLRSDMDLLTLRIRYIRAVEQLLSNVQEGIQLEEQLSEVNSVLETLEHMLAAEC